MALVLPHYIPWTSFKLWLMKPVPRAATSDMNRGRQLRPYLMTAAFCVPMLLNTPRQFMGKWAVFKKPVSFHYPVSFRISCNNQPKGIWIIILTFSNLILRPLFIHLLVPPTFSMSFAAYFRGIPDFLWLFLWLQWFTNLKFDQESRWKTCCWCYFGTKQLCPNLKKTYFYIKYRKSL